MSDKPSMKVRGEDAAVAYLNRCGMTVVERSWASEAGRIDVVALDGETIVLLDVKTRRAGKVEPGATDCASIRRRINRIIKAYVEGRGLHGSPVRYDRIELLVISEDRALLRHHRDVFSLSS